MVFCKFVCCVFSQLEFSMLLAIRRALNVLKYITMSKLINIYAN